MPQNRALVRKLILAIGIPLFAFMTLAAWSLSSPAGSSADDNFHLASIWCGAGERDGVCELTSDDTTDRLVPSAIVEATCYAFDPEKSASCWTPDAAGMSVATHLNSGGLYPPVFYATMSIFVSSDISTSIIAMRLFNSALAVGLLTVVFFALPRRMRPALVISIAVTSVPLGLSVLASTNPSAWAILSAATVWITLYAATQTRGRQQLVLSCLAVFSAVIGAGARADAAVYAIFAVGMAAILGFRFQRQALIPTVSAVLVIIASVALYLSTGQGAAVVDGLENDNAPLSMAGHLGNLLEIPSLWVGALGGWGLGWLDTNMPAAVYVVTTAVFFSAIFVGTKHARTRRILAIALSLAAMWLVPFVLLAQSNAIVGTLVQPRYILPLMMIAVGVASLRVDAGYAWRGSRFVLAATGLWLAATIALHRNIARYTTGVDKLQPDPGGGAEWWWTAAPSPLAVWVVGSLAFAAVFAGIWVVLRHEVSADTHAT